MSVLDWIHGVTVSRKAGTTTGGVYTAAFEGVTFTDQQGNTYTTVKCRLEAIDTEDMPSAVGVLATTRFKMTWGTETIIEGDEIHFQGQAYVVEKKKPDMLRPLNPYQTCIISQVAGRA